MTSKEERRTPIGEAVLLEPAGERHLDGLDALLNHPAVARSLGGARSRGAILDTIRRERAHLIEHGFAPWVVIDRQAGSVLGRGGLRRAAVLGRSEVELFYAVLPSSWNQGIATEIARAALQLAFEQLGLESVIAFTTEANLASQRVVTKLGLVRETTFEHAGLPHFLYRMKKAEYAGKSFNAPAWSRR